MCIRIKQYGLVSYGIYISYSHMYNGSATLE